MRPAARRGRFRQQAPRGGLKRRVQVSRCTPDFWIGTPSLRDARANIIAELPIFLVRVTSRVVLNFVLNSQIISAHLRKRSAKKAYLSDLQMNL